MAAKTTNEMTDMVAMPAVVSIHGVSSVISSALYFSTRIITNLVQLTPTRK